MSGELQNQEALTPTEEPAYHVIGGCVRPRVGLGTVDNKINSCLRRESNNDSSRYSVTSTDLRPCDHPSWDGLCVARCGGLLACKY